MIKTDVNQRHDSYQFNKGIDSFVGLIVSELKENIA